MDRVLSNELKGFKPLAFMDGALILYKKGALFRYRDSSLAPLIRIGADSWKDRTRIVIRLLRREPKYAKPIDDFRLLIVYRHKILLVDLKEKTTRTISLTREGFSDPLNICTETENWIAVWGDYGNNAAHLPVHLYGLKKDLSVEIIYSFSAGEIRHVHNIIPCQEGFYIFTGDNESHAGIYKADPLFRTIAPVMTGKQQYRAVIGFSTEKGLLYATDAVNERNYIYLLNEREELTSIAPLNGSCIYGSKVGNSYWFSTTVEPDESNRGIFSWISRKRGAGILNDDVHLVKVSNELKVDSVLKLKKDIYPMKLMQYGCIQFPNGETNEMWIYPVAVKKYDGSAVKVNL